MQLHKPPICHCKLAFLHGWLRYQWGWGFSSIGGWPKVFANASC